MSADNLPATQKDLEAFLPKKTLSINDVLPVFSYQQKPLVFIENSHYDAKLFRYDQPLTILGKAGFIIDYGFRIGFFPSTWQGQGNQSLLFQDLQFIIHIAKHRTLPSKSNYQKGMWKGEWLLGGEGKELIQMLEKLISDL